ncbi:MAG: methyl-accepting chemotaxis protein [Planctomycetia bacterium]|nr:methyl-accepting chemotaxis protein [Planctomycetia bacterium]
MALSHTLRGWLPSELKIWHKISAICLAFVIPIAVLLYLYVNEQQKPIDFAQKELYGTEYLRPCRSLMEHVQQHRHLLHQQLTGEKVAADELSKKALEIDADLRALDQVDQKHGKLLSQEDRVTANYLAAIKAKWQDVKALKSSAKPEASDELHEAMVAKNRELIGLVGDTSNLILDPDLDSYYLMDAVLLKQPDGQDSLGQLANFAEEILARKDLTPEERTEFVVRTGLIRANSDNLNSGLIGMRVSFKNDSTVEKRLQPWLEPSLTGSVAATNAYLDDLKKKVIDPAKPDLTPAASNAAAAKALEANYKLWDETVKALDLLLQKRIDGFRANMRWALAGAAVALLAAVLLVFLIVRGFTRQIAAMQDLFTQLGIGNFQARAAIVSNDELGQITTMLNDNLLPLVQSREEKDQIQQSIAKLLEEVAGVADGDLSKDAEVTTDVTGAIADSFNYMIEQLRKVIGNVQDATLQVSSSANEIHATTEHLAQGSEAQAEQIVNTSAAIDEMAVSIQQVSENAALSANVAQQSLVNARTGNEAVQNTIQGMNRIRDQVQETAKRIKRLGESSQEIGQIIQLIDDIADRTSILALNASIQAAMAGEAGRGFAVVAEEVERLAVRSTDATKKIATLVKTIQSETNEAVGAMEKGIQEVVEGSKLAGEAGQALGEIQGVSNRLAELIQSISLASKQQARGSEALAKSMGEISQITQQTAAGTKQAAESVNELAGLADDLRSSVSTFRLPGVHANGNGNGNGHAPVKTADLRPRGKEERPENRRRELART